MTFGERLQKAMDVHGYNPYQLANAAGITVSQVTRALRDERTGWEHTTLTKVSRACGVRPEWLSLEDGPMLAAGALRRLRDRKEWRSVVAQVRLAHREIAAEDVDAVGNLADDGWTAKLDGPLVATLAAARRAWLSRQNPHG